MKKSLDEKYRTMAIEKFNSQEQFGGSFSKDEIQSRNELMQQQEFVRLKSMYINRDFHKIKEDYMKNLGDKNEMEVQHY